MLDLYFIRHAEEEGEEIDRIGGRQEKNLLSQRGLHQTNQLKIRLKKEKIIFHEVHTSTASRAKDTAINSLEILEEALLIHPELIELDTGEWEGRLESEVLTPEILSRFLADPLNFVIPGGELLKGLEERMSSWLQKNFLSRYHQNIIVAIFAHQMSIKSVLKGILNLSPLETYRMKLDNTSITRLQYDEKGWHVITINDIAHLL